MFIILGIFVGTIGTLIGVGGGFILLPVLFLVYPDARHESLAAVSLIVIFFNSLSGTISYGKMGRINYKSGMFFLVTAVPASVIGALVTPFLPVEIFKGIFGILMIVVASIIISTKVQQKDNKIYNIKSPDKQQNETLFSSGNNLRKGMLLSSGTGFISSILGIGGGVFNVPLMTKILGYPVFIATATSQFMIVFMSSTGALTHAITGNIAGFWIQAVLISFGAVFGSIIGARLSAKLESNWIMRIFAVCMVIVGLRMLTEVII